MNRKNNTTIGLDIAKNVFHYAELNRNGRVTGSGVLKRNKVLSHFAGVESSKVVMEACAGSHYWGPQLQECGHEVILLPAHKVTPYVQGNKNDKNDSIAIAEAAGRPGIRAVAVKTVEQQNMMMLHGLRQQAVQQRTQQRNALRAHLSERGLTIGLGKSALYGLIESMITPDEDGVIGSSFEIDGLFVSMLAKEYRNLRKLDQEVEDYDTRIKALVNGSDAEAGFGGPLNVFELTKAMIKAGAAGIHYEDQLSSEKKCGHLGGKVLLSTAHGIRNLTSARLAADVMGVPTVIIARTDAEAARLLTSDIDERDHPFLTGERTTEGFYRITGGIDMCIARGLSYAPYSDLIWMETSTPNLEDARNFAEGIHEQFPGEMLAYNCSPSFNWQRHLERDELASFQRDIAAMGYRYQFVTLASFHSVNYSSFDIARKFIERGMEGYSDLQQAEFAAEDFGFSATRHQHEVGVSYFDAVNEATAGTGETSTVAMADLTETAQF